MRLSEGRVSEYTPTTILLKIKEIDTDETVKFTDLDIVRYYEIMEIGGPVEDGGVKP
jgi:hypothetical protein